MSAYILENGDFAPFYGVTILSYIKNIDDFRPLFSVLKQEKDIVLVDKLNLKIYDIYSQTLASLIGDSCKAIDDWYSKHGGVLKPYQFLEFDTILSSHYEAKEVLQKNFPQDFEISKNLELRIKNNKLILHFNFKIPEHKKSIENIYVQLNKIYGTKKQFSRSIVIGYIKKSPFTLSLEKLTLLNSLIPKKIFVNAPDVFQYKNLNSYVHYTQGMY